jgi:hypothetical protein
MIRLRDMGVYRVRSFSTLSSLRCFASNAASQHYYTNKGIKKTMLKKVG